MNVIKLTAEQNQLYEKVQELIENKNGLLVVDSPAGTGKTFFINYLVNKLRNQDKKCQVLAPTHKAASLFKCGAATIHRFFGADSEYDDDGKLVFTFKDYRGKLDILIVDEASMIDEAMYAKFIKLSETVPILCCGDEMQIPPVNEMKSLIFDVPDRFAFTKNMRSRDSLSNHWLKKFRDFITTGNIVCVDKTDKSIMLDSFRNGEDSIVLAWTRVQVACWNTRIRTCLFAKPNEQLAKYYAGERLIFSGYRNVKNEQTILLHPYLMDVVEKVKLINPEFAFRCEFEPTFGRYYSSDIFTIDHIEQRDIYVPFYRCECKTQNQDYKTKVLKCKDCNINGHNVGGHMISYYVLYDNSGVIWLTPSEKDEKKISTILSDFRAHCKHKKNKHLWRKYYGIVEILKPDINYVYASTVHKAQGSQWDNVFVDINNIRTCRDHNLSSRLQYTAVSRMMNEILFI